MTLFVRRHNDCCNERDKSQGDYGKNYGTCVSQFSLVCLGNVGLLILRKVDANGQVKGNPVLDDAHAELRTLLHRVYVQ